MRVAILGAGFAGLATTWFLMYHSQGSVTVDLYDPSPLGTGVSGISSGLLHPYAGKSAKRVADADKKITATNKLIHAATDAAGKSLVLSKGILRPAITLTQIEDFKKCALIHTADTTWWSKEECEAKVKGLVIPHTEGGGLYIKQALTLDAPAYLAALWQASALFGAQFHQTGLVGEKELRRYDHVIFAVGQATKSVKPLQSLPIELVKGQVVKLKWPEDLPPLPFSLVSEGHLVMQREGKTCLAGSTYERNFSSSGPDPEKALADIRKKVSAFFPRVEEMEMVGCEAGVRASSQKTHLPLVGKVADKIWFATGLGSKGLLYHAWIGDTLSQAILKNDPSLLPPEVFYRA